MLSVPNHRSTDHPQEPRVVDPIVLTAGLDEALVQMPFCGAFAAVPAWLFFRLHHRGCSLASALPALAFATKQQLYSRDKTLSILSALHS